MSGAVARDCDVLFESDLISRTLRHPQSARITLRSHRTAGRWRKSCTRRATHEVNQMSRKSACHPCTHPRRSNEKKITGAREHLRYCNGCSCDRPRFEPFPGDHYPCPPDPLRVFACLQLRSGCELRWLLKQKNTGTHERAGARRSQLQLGLILT